jgi:hypothetical protein
MSKGTMTVLLHTVEYDTGNIVIDADAEDTLHDIIHDSIGFDKKTEGTEILELEDNEENRLPVDVSWKIVNPEAEEWKQLATTLYEDLKHGFTQEALEQDLKQYEELIKQTTHE